MALLGLLAAVLLYRSRYGLQASLVRRFRDSERFWRSRRLLRSWTFSLAKLRYRSRFSRERSGDLARVSMGFLRRGVIGLLFGAFFSMAIYLVEDALFDALAKGRWVQRNVSWLHEIVTGSAPIDSTLYSTVIAAAVGVLGVFIALFVSALATSSEPLSGRVSIVARRLLLKDPQVSLISGLFSFGVTVSLILLLAQAGGARPSLIGVASVTFLTALAVLVAALLVRRGFYFVDPSRLVHVPLREIHRAARLATARGYRFSDPSFQASYRQWANASLQDVRVLWDSEIQGPSIQDPNVAAMARSVMSLLLNYQALKREMPTDTLWYERQPKHQEWYLASHAEVQVADATETPLQPKLEPNPFWIEDAIVRLATTSIEKSLELTPGAAATEILSDLSVFIQSVGTEWECRQATNWISSISRPISALLVDWTPNPRSPSLADDYRLAMVDGLGLLPIGLLLGVFERVRELAIEGVCRSVMRLRWTSDIYSVHLPQRGRKVLEELSLARDFEARAESPITASWYFEQLVVRALEYQLEESVMALARVPKDLFKDPAEEALDQGRFLLAAIMLTRGVEYCHKFLASWEDLEQFVNDAKGRHVLSDLPSPSWELDPIRDELIATRLQLLESLCRCIPGLALLERPPNWPDLFGRAVHIAGDLCVQAAIDDQPETLKKIFDLYLLGVLTVYEKLRQQLEGYEPRTYMALVTDPLIDLMEVSGYCFLMSELTGNASLWHPIKQAWERYLDVDGGRKQRLEALAAIVQFDRSLFAIRPRALWRTGWKGGIDRRLEEVPQEYENGGWIPEKRPKHDSPLVRVFANDAPMGSMYSGADVFVDLYLSQLEDAKDLDFGGRHHLLDSLEHPDGHNEEVAALINRALRGDGAETPND